MIKAEHALMMAAAASCRFAPLSYERHKGLVDVGGEDCSPENDNDYMMAKRKEAFRQLFIAMSIGRMIL